MSRHEKNGPGVKGIYSFALTWLVLSLVLPIYELWGFLATFAASFLVSLLVSKMSSRKNKKAEETIEETEQKEASVSYGPEIDPILEEGMMALKEMARLYSSIKDPEIRKKINEIMRITDKIAQDAIADPSDIPQIKKFMNYYLPTTIKLLNAYDRMSAQGIEGENLDKSMQNITEMLDEAIVAYKKRLDSLFANQALDIETDIHVMNTMLAREGLSGTKDFEI